MLDQIRRLIWIYIDKQRIPEETANWVTIGRPAFYRRGFYRRRENVVVKDCVGRAMLIFQRTGDITKTAHFRPTEAVEVLVAIREELPLDALADL